MSDFQVMWSHACTYMQCGAACVHTCNVEPRVYIHVHVYTESSNEGTSVGLSAGESEGRVWFPQGFEKFQNKNLGENILPVLYEPNPDFVSFMKISFLQQH